MAGFRGAGGVAVAATEGPPLPARQLLHVTLGSVLVPVTVIVQPEFLREVQAAGGAARAVRSCGALACCGALALAPHLVTILFVCLFAFDAAACAGVAADDRGACAARGHDAVA